MTMRASDYAKEAQRAYAIWRGGQPDLDSTKHWKELHPVVQEAFVSVYFTARLDAANGELARTKEEGQ